MKKTTIFFITFFIFSFAIFGQTTSICLNKFMSDTDKFKKNITFNAYVKDENGNFLSIAEVRERLIAGKTLVLNEDANWNNKQKQTKEEYLEEYMAKNLYWMECVQDSRFNPESRYRAMNNQYIALKPLGFATDPKVKGKSSVIVTHDPEYFWQKP